MSLCANESVSWAITFALSLFHLAGLELKGQMMQLVFLYARLNSMYFSYE